MELFVLMNNEGQFMRAKGFSGYGKSWVDTIKTARIYTHIRPAKAQVTYWKKHYPEFECPKIVILEATIKETLDQSKRVEIVIEKQKEDEIKLRRRNLEYQILSLKKEIVGLEQKLINE